MKMVEQITKEAVKFDVPYRELGFYGTPFRSEVFLQPSVNCLVNLTEMPFFMLNIDEIEIASFERVNVAAHFSSG